jgi:hypothetical protein
MERRVVLKLERETRNTYRFQKLNDGEPEVIGTLYVQKWIFSTKPSTITLVIEADESA